MFSNKYCSFNFLFILKIIAAQLVFHINKQHIRMISDHVTVNTGVMAAWKLIFSITEINNILKYPKIEKQFFKLLFTILLFLLYI